MGWGSGSGWRPGGGAESGGSLPAAGNGSLVTYTALAPGHTNLPRLPDVAISTLFQPGHGYTKGTGNATLSDDTTTFVYGNQSLKMACPGDGVSSTARNSAVTAIDATAKYVAVTLMCDNWANLTAFAFYAGSGGWTNFSIAGLIDSPLHDYFVNGQWVTVLIPWGAFGAGGGSNAARNNLTAFELLVRCANASAGCNVWINKISTVAEAANGVASITFDDGYLSQFTIARPYMDTYGFKGTFAPIIDAFGEGNGSLAYMTLAQAQALYVAGWEPAVHAYAGAIHNAYTTVTDAQVETDIQQAKSFMRANALGLADSFVVPEGHYGNNTDRLDIFKRYFWCARSISLMERETYPPADPFLLRAIPVDSAHTSATINAWIDEAVSYNEWVILIVHNPAASDPGAGTWVSTATFQAVMDHLYSSAIKVKTVRDVLLNGVA